jgi:hypothetical protein
MEDFVDAVVSVPVEGLTEARELLEYLRRMERGNAVGLKPGGIYALNNRGEH